MTPRQCSNSDDQEAAEHEATPLLVAGTSSGGHGATSNESSTPCLEEKTTTSSSSSAPSAAIPATAALASAMLVQSYLLVGVFPYSGFLAMHLVPSLNEETAGRYAGLIASSFMAGRTITSFHWGRAADRYGRTFTIKTSLLLSAVFSILFGLAPTLPLALAARFALGLSNGIIGSIKTIIMEMSDGHKSRETKTMAIVMGMWGYGFLINPAISGYLADPIRQYPNSNFVEGLDSFLNLTADPFLLPNLAGSLFCILAYLMVYSYVNETLPVEKLEQFTWSNLVPSYFKRAAIIRTVSSFGVFKHMHVVDAEVQANEDDDNIKDQYGSIGTQRVHDADSLPRWVRPSPSTTALTILSSRTSDTRASKSPNMVDTGVCQKMESQSEEKETVTIKLLWSRQSTRKLLVMYWIYSFIVITVDETFPLYCMSKYSGLGVEEKIIGKLLSGAGMGYIIIQYFLLTSLVDRFGFYKSMRIGAFCSVPVVSLLPISLITNRNAAEGTLTWSTLILVSVVFAITRACSSVVFSTLTMTTNRTVPAHQRAAMNGLGMLGGSVFKAMGPAFAGLLFSESVGRVTPPLGSVVVWTIIACFGLAFFVQTHLLPEHANAQNETQVPSSVRNGHSVQLTSKEVDTGNASMTHGEDKRPLSF